jgi:hypothetical protein
MLAPYAAPPSTSPLPASVRDGLRNADQVYHSATAAEFISDAVNTSIGSRFVRIGPSNILSDYNTIITPYSANAFETALKTLHLTSQYPNLVHHLRHGFPMGNFEPIRETTIFRNDSTVETYRTQVDSYLAEEKAAGHMIGPFTQPEMERVCGGPFWCCPMTVVYTAADTAAVPPKPEKFRPCTNASKKKKDGISINDQIDSDEFPTRWGSAAQMGEYVSKFYFSQTSAVSA